MFQTTNQKYDSQSPSRHWNFKMDPMWPSPSTECGISTKAKVHTSCSFIRPTLLLKQTCQTPTNNLAILVVITWLLFKIVVNIFSFYIWQLVYRYIYTYIFTCNVSINITIILISSLQNIVVINSLNYVLLCSDFIISNIPITDVWWFRFCNIKHL